MSTSSLGFSSANLSSLFQTSYANALKGKNALGSTSSLASSALFGSLAPGSNPLDPLQGQTAIMGLSGFVSGLQQSYAARKAAAASGSATDPSALLSSLTGGSGSGSTSGMSSSDMLSALSSMLGMLGGGGSSSGSSSRLNSSLLNGFSSTGSGSSTLGFDQTGLGGLTGLNALNGTYQYPSSRSSASAFDVSADQTGTGAMLTQLQSMLPALTSMMSMLGGSSNAGSGKSTGGASSAAAMLPQLQSMLSTLTSMMGGSSSAGAGTGTQSPYSPYGASAANTSSLTGANPLSSPTLFNQKVNMNLIDSAINQTLGSISNTLPMVRM
jgi:hypothetical protein